MKRQNMTREEGGKLLAEIKVKIINHEANDDEMSLFMNYAKFLGLLCEEIERIAPEMLKEATQKITSQALQHDCTVPENTIIH